MVQIKPPLEIKCQQIAKATSNYNLGMWTEMPIIVLLMLSQK